MKEVKDKPCSASQNEVIRDGIKHKSTVNKNGCSRTNPQGRRTQPRVRVAAGAEGKAAGAAG